MTAHRIRFEGPAAIAIGVATQLADADGVDLVSSRPPSKVDEHTVALDVDVNGTLDDVTAAVAHVRHGIPKGASIEIAGT